MARIYIAGKITGLDAAECEERFEVAARLITDRGHTPLNPVRLVDQAEGRTYNEYLLDALKIVLTQAEGVYMLPNWLDSKGARIEYTIAAELGLPIYNVASDLPDAAAA